MIQSTGAQLHAVQVSWYQYLSIFMFLCMHFITLYPFTSPPISDNLYCESGEHQSYRSDLYRVVLAKCAPQLCDSQPGLDFSAHISCTHFVCVSFVSAIISTPLVARGSTAITPAAIAYTIRNGSFPISSKKEAGTSAPRIAGKTRMAIFDGKIPSPNASRSFSDDSNM